MLGYVIASILLNQMISIAYIYRKIKSLKNIYIINLRYLKIIKLNFKE